MSAKKKVSKKTTKKKVTKKTAKKKVSKKKVAKKTTKAVVPAEDKIDNKVALVMKQVQVANASHDNAVIELTKGMTKGGQLLLESGGVMAMTNTLKEVLPVGETKSLDTAYYTMRNFQDAHKKVLGVVAELNKQIEELPEYKTLKAKLDKAETAVKVSKSIEKVFNNYLVSNAEKFFSEFNNHIETPMNLKFLYKIAHSLKVSDIETLPNEYKTAKIVLKEVSDLEKVQKFLAENEIEAEVEFAQTKDQKASLKTFMSGNEREHIEYMMATEEEREKNGLKDNNANESIKGATNEVNLSVINEFKVSF